MITWVDGRLLDGCEASCAVGVVLRCDHFVCQVHIFRRRILRLWLCLSDRLLLLLLCHVSHDFRHGELLALRLTHRPHFELWRLLLLCLYGLLLLIFLRIINDFDFFGRHWLCDSSMFFDLGLDYFWSKRRFFGSNLLVKWFDIHLLTFILLLTRGLCHFLVATIF